jgi:phytoene dehydrogenase-like protein
VRRVLESVARVSLYSAALDIASADVFVLRVQQSLKHPVQYIDGGWQTLVDGLRSAAQSAGAEILTSASAASIEIDDGAATHVVLHDGRVIGCSAVIVAAPPEDVSHLLTEAVAPRLHHMLTELVPTHIACLDLALERLPVARNAVVFDIEQPRFLTAQSAFAQIAPDDGAVVHLMLQLDPRQSGDPARERGALEALMDEVQPGWRELCVERRFLPRMLASSTLPLAGSGGLAGRPPVVCPDLANVYVAGDWIGADGYLADAALGSAREAARLAMTTQPRRALLAA